MSYYEELFSETSQSNHLLTYTAIQEGTVPYLIESGLLGVAICFHGGNTSFMFAEHLVKRGYQVMRLQGGIEGLWNIEDWQEYYALIINTLNTLPHIFLFMTDQDTTTPCNERLLARLDLAKVERYSGYRSGVDKAYELLSSYSPYA